MSTGFYKKYLNLKNGFAARLRQNHFFDKKVCEKVCFGNFSLCEKRKKCVTLHTFWAVNTVTNSIFGLTIGCGCVIMEKNNKEKVYDGFARHDL